MVIDNILFALNCLFAAAMPVTHIIGYGAAILSAAFVWRYWKDITEEPVFLWLIVFFIYGMMIMPFSAEPKIGLGAMTGYLTHWICPFILGYGITEFNKAKIAFGVYFALISVVTLLSLAAYFGLFPKVVHGNFYLIEGGLLKAGRSHIAFAALCIFISFFLIAIPVYAKKHGIKQLAWLIPATIYIFAIVLSGSRGYYISAAIVYSLFVVIWAVINGKVRYLFVLGAVVCLCAALVFKFNPEIRQRVMHTRSGEQNVSERLNLYKVGLEEIKARPIFGYGPGQGIKQKEYFEKLPENMRNIDRHPALHSFYLNLTADFGLAGLAIFGIIIVLIFKRLLAIQHSDASVNLFAFALFWGLSGLLIGDCFDTILRGPGVAMELFWALGIVFRLSKEEGV